MKEKIKIYGFTHDAVFKKVLYDNPEICQEMIRRVLPEFKDEVIKKIEKEKEIIVSTENRKVRMDILVSTDDARLNLEMYRYHTDVPKAARLDAAMIDSQQVPGISFGDIPDVIVIFFCTFDPFKLGMPVYHVHSHIDEYSN